MPERIHGTHHVGITVRNLKSSLEFYHDLFGLEPEMIAEGSGPDLSRAVQVPDTELSFAFLNTGNAIIELLEYKHPKGRDYDRYNCDVGAAHVCFEVPDIEEAYARMTANGIAFTAPPHHIDGGPLDGCSFAYFSDPDGLTLEIFQDPREKR